MAPETLPLTTVMARLVSGPGAIAAPRRTSRGVIRSRPFRCSNQAELTTSSNRVRFRASRSAPNHRRGSVTFASSSVKARSQRTETSAGLRLPGSSMGRVSA